MTTYKTILIPVDPQGGAAQVLKKAAKLNDIASADIHLLHAFEDPKFVYSGLSAFGALMDLDEDHMRKYYREQLQELAEQAGLDSVTVHAEAGRPADVIMASAKQLNTDLIVVGSHGRHGIGLLLGSTANNVLNHANCDVIAIRVSEDESLEG